MNEDQPKIGWIIAGIVLMVIGSTAILGWQTIRSRQVAIRPPAISPRSAPSAPITPVVPVPSPAPAAVVSQTATALPEGTPTHAAFYASDFSKPVGPAWSESSLARTPNTRTPFLGQFGNDTVSLHLTALPKHDFLRLTLWLYIINTWDGIAPHNGGSRIGPDFWSLDLSDGPNLIRTTFSNTNDDPGFARSARYQNYPAPIPSDPVLWGTGAESKNALGYIFTFKGFNVSFPMDSVYAIDVTIPHTAGEVEFNFTGAELQGISDEGWGLNNVRVEALEAKDVPLIPSGDFDGLLTAAAGNDPIAANRAFWNLVSGGNITAVYLASEVKSLAVNTTHAKQAVKDLTSTDPATVARAVAELSSYGPAIESLLPVTDIGYGDDNSPVRKIEEANVIRPVVSPERRRGAVAARVLSIINTPKSHDVLDKLIAASADDPVLPEDWGAALGKDYRLDPGQVLKYVPPPWLPQRQDYWQLQQRRENLIAGETAENFRPMPSQIVFHVFDQDIDLSTRIDPVYWQQLHPGVYGPGQGLTSVLGLLNIGTGMQVTPKLIVPKELESGFAMEGDWLLRFRAKPTEVLAALEPILKAQTGRSIHFKRQAVQEDVFRVRGTYAFKSVTAAQPNDTVIIFAGEPPAVLEQSIYKGTANLSDLLSTLSRFYQTPFVDETGQKIPMSWDLQPSARPINGDMTKEALDQVLKNFASQTGLEFVRDQRSTDVLVATDDSAPATKVEK